MIVYCVNIAVIAPLISHPATTPARTLTHATKKKAATAEAIDVNKKNKTTGEVSEANNGPTSHPLLKAYPRYRKMFKEAVKISKKNSSNLSIVFNLKEFGFRMYLNFRQMYKFSTVKQKYFQKNVTKLSESGKSVLSLQRLFPFE